MKQNDLERDEEFSAEGNKTLNSTNTENTENTENKTDIPDPVEDNVDNTIVFPKWFSRFSDSRRIAIVLSTLVISIFLVVVAVDAIAVGMYRNQDVKLMHSVGKNAVEKMQDAVNTSYDFSILNSYTDEYMSIYSDSQDMQFFLFNSRGICVMSSSNYTGERDSLNLSETQMENVVNTNSFSPTLAGIDTDASYLCYGEAFNVQSKSIEEEYYLLVIFVDKNFDNFCLWLIFTSLGVLAVILAVAILVIRVQYRHYKEYFLICSEIVQRYAKDDFSVKIPIPEYTKPDYFICMAEATNTLADNIETSEERRKQFISNVSHELRTPMTSICGFVDGILDGTIPPSQEKKYLTIVSQETRRLKNMIQSMLNLTRIESGTLQLPKAEFNLTDVAVRTLLLFENQILEKNIEVVCDTGISYRINGNHDYIQQIIYNLIENAVKFVNEGGVITLAVYQDAENPDFIDLSIKNTGEGLSPSEIPKIFDRFYKTDRSRSKDKTGLGLGLTICRRIVHLHGGTIIVKSAEGEYTEFIVQLPIDNKKAVIK